MKLLYILLFLFSNIALFAQNTHCLQLIEVSDSPTEYVLSLNIQGASAFGLGSSNIQFTFDETVLGNPTLVSTTLPAEVVTPFGTFTIYNDVFVSTPIPGVASFNTFLAAVNNGTQMAASPGFTEVAVISFPKLAAGAIPGPFEFRPSGSVVYDDDETTLLQPTSLSCLVGLSSAPLPVEFLSFSANRAGNDALLNWETAAEINNAGFLVEHSRDARNWAELTWVDAKGSGSAYSMVHSKPAAGIHYYRLRQKDHDDTESFSEVRAVEFASPTDGAEQAIVVWPNPTRTSFQASFSEQVTATLVGIDGRVVWEGQVGPSIEINISNLSEGVYFLQAPGYGAEKVMVVR